MGAAPREEPKKAIKAEFVLPFTKEIFQSKADQPKLFTETVVNIRKNLSKEGRNNITILKTTIAKKDGKKWRAVRLVALPKMQNIILELKLNGIDVRGKHIKAWGPREHNICSSLREKTIHFRSLPHFFEDEDVYENIKLPDVRKLSPIVKEISY